MAKKGKKPIDGLSEEKIKLRYPWIQGSQDACGKMNMSCGDPNYPEEVFEAQVAATGSTSTREYDKEKQEFNISLNTGETRSYTAGSTSNHNDGHVDTNSESTIRQNSAGDFGVAYKTGYEVAVAGKNTAIREYNKTFTTSASESKSFNGTFGDQVNEHSGNWHEAFEKDRVSAISGNDITMVGGDSALHVQSGNYDVHVAQKGKIYTGSDLLIESATKIVFKVGASTITMTPGNIKMVSPRIDLN